MISIIIFARVALDVGYHVLWTPITIPLEFSLMCQHCYFQRWCTHSGRCYK